MEATTTDMAEAAPEIDPVGQIGSEPVCKTCGSTEVRRDAWAIWNPMTGVWELGQAFDYAHCETCEAETTLVWRPCAENRATRIRRLNDAFRTGGGIEGMVLITSGVRAKGTTFVELAMRTVIAFDAFTEDNDPHGEHDCGAFELAGERLFWKIDLYDLDLIGGSPDPTDPSVTRRVLTILLAEEY